MVRYLWTGFANLMGVSWMFERKRGGIVHSWATLNPGHKKEGYLEHHSSDSIIVCLD